MMMNYAADLHRKGELNKVEEMERLAKRFTRNKDMGIAFVTEGFYNEDSKSYVDGFGLIANRPEYVQFEGYIAYDLDNNKPVFIQDKE